MKTSLLNEVFYSECAVCSKTLTAFEYVCPECSKTCVKEVQNFCSSCGYPLEIKTKFCKNCTENRSYKKIFVPYWYTGIIRKAIKSIKFNFGLSEKLFVKKLVVQYLSANQNILQDYDIITSVPSNFSRRFTRFILLPEFISKCISDFSGIPFEKLLKKQRKTKSQYKLTKKERVKNVKDAFLCKSDVLDLKILLIDDIITTGSTLNECSKALLKKGAFSVDCFAFTKGYFR